MTLHPTAPRSERRRGRWDDIVAGLASYSAAVAAAAAFAVSTTLTHRIASHRIAAQVRCPTRKVFSHVSCSASSGRSRPPLLAGRDRVKHGGAGLARLNGGALAVVQLLMVVGVLFALLLQRRLRHERIPRTELWSALALVLRLAGFLLVATAGVPAIHESPDRGPASAAGLLTVGTAAGRHRHRYRPRWDRYPNQGLHQPARHSPTTLLTSWQLYAMLVAGAVGLLLNQLSFQAGPLRACLPAITVVNPCSRYCSGSSSMTRTCATPPGPSPPKPVFSCCSPRQPSR